MLFAKIGLYRAIASAYKSDLYLSLSASRFHFPTWYAEKLKAEMHNSFQVIQGLPDFAQSQESMDPSSIRQRAIVATIFGAKALICSVMALLQNAFVVTLEMRPAVYEDISRCFLLQV